MKKSDLVAKMKEKNDSFTADILSKAVDAVFSEINASLAGGHRVEIRGFGAFSVLAKAERMGRNPKTGEPVKILAKNVVHFKSGKELKELVN
jgi:integration host factor subunit beta